MVPEHLTTVTFESQLQTVEQDVLEMASRAELMFIRSMDALARLDSDVAKQVIESDEKVDQIDLRIESRCLSILSTVHPEGPDLRVVGAILKIITDIERVADLSVDNARCAIKIDRELGESRSVDLPRMAELARSMFHFSIEGYVRQDMRVIARVVEMEQQVDQLFREIRDQIHDRMRQNADEVITLSFLLIALHNIERVADHAVNISERVAYMITGVLPSY